MNAPNQAATLRIAFHSPQDAATALRALSADNGTFLTASVDGSVLVLSAHAASPLGLLRTLDDALNGLRATGLVD